MHCPFAITASPSSARHFIICRILHSHRIEQYASIVVDGISQAQAQHLKPFQRLKTIQQSRAPRLLLRLLTEQCLKHVLLEEN
jgi:hypothetical protein